MGTTPQEAQRTRQPGLYSVPVLSWKHILIQTLQGIGINHLSLLAAGVAFYMLFAIFPALGAAVSLLGLLSALALMQPQLAALASKPGAGLSIAGLVNLAIALFTARTAASSMIEALNSIYEVEESRGILKLNTIALLFTIVAVIGMVLAVALVLIVPAVFNLGGFEISSARLIGYLRWAALAAVTVLALAVTYRYGPNRNNACWRSFTLGSVVATLVWLAASFGFSWYVGEFNSYDRVYGSLGAVVILLFWFWLTAFAALLGAQLDKQIEEEAEGHHRQYQARPA